MILKPLAPPFRRAGFVTLALCGALGTTPALSAPVTLGAAARPLAAPRASPLGGLLILAQTNDGDTGISQDPDPSPNPGPDPDPGTDPGTDPDTDPGTDPGTGPEPSPEPGPEPETDPDSYPGYGRPDSGKKDPKTVRNSPTTPIPPAVTDKIATALKLSEKFCEVIPEIYRIDCLAEQYEAVARSLKGNTQDRFLRDALLKTAAQLRGIAQQSRDPGEKKKRFRVSGQGVNARTKRSLVPVAKPRLKAANKAASAAVEELSTVLLRAAEQSKNRKAHYTKIAAVVNSNKVLLRS